MRLIKKLFFNVTNDFFKTFFTKNGKRKVNVMAIKPRNVNNELAIQLLFYTNSAAMSSTFIGFPALFA